MPPYAPPTEQFTLEKVHVERGRALELTIHPVAHHGLMSVLNEPSEEQALRDHAALRRHH